MARDLDSDDVIMGTGQAEEFSNSLVHVDTPEGYEFVAWESEQGVLYTDEELPVFMGKDRSLKALFKIKRHEVVLTGENAQFQGAGIYKYGDTANISAQPDEHYEFIRWENYNFLDKTLRDQSFIVENDIEIKAIVRPKSYDLTVNFEEGGTAISNGVFEYDTSPLIQSETDEHYLFDGWELTDGDSIILNEDDQTTSIKILSDTTIKAKYVKRRYDVILESLGGGKVFSKNINTNESTENSQTYDYNTPIEIYAVPDEGYEFLGWVERSFPQEISTNIDRHYYLRAKFRKKEYYVTISGVQKFAYDLMHEDGITGDVRPDLDQKYNQNDIAIIDVFPNIGWELLGIEFRHKIINSDTVNPMSFSIDNTEKATIYENATDSYVKLKDSEGNYEIPADHYVVISNKDKGINRLPITRETEIFPLLTQVKYQQIDLSESGTTVCAQRGKTVNVYNYYPYEQRWEKVFDFEESDYMTDQPNQDLAINSFRMNRQGTGFAFGQDGIICVYHKREGEWEKKINTITGSFDLNGETRTLGKVFSLGLSDDSNTIIAGCRADDDTSPGEVFIFKYDIDDDDWKLSGYFKGKNDLGRFFGTSVDITSDGSFAAASDNQQNAGTEYGYVKFFLEVGGEWSLIQSFNLKTSSDDPGGSLLRATGIGQAITLSKDGSYFATTSQGQTVGSQGFTVFETTTFSEIKKVNSNYRTTNGEVLRFNNDGTLIMSGNTVVYMGFIYLNPDSGPRITVSNSLNTFGKKSGIAGASTRLAYSVIYINIDGDIILNNNFKY